MLKETKRNRVIKMKGPGKRDTKEDCRYFLSEALRDLPPPRKVHVSSEAQAHGLWHDLTYLTDLTKG